MQQIGGGGFSTYVSAFLSFLPLSPLHDHAVNFEDHRMAEFKLVLLTFSPNLPP